MIKKFVIERVSFTIVIEPFSLRGNCGNGGPTRPVTLSKNEGRVYPDSIPIIPWMTAKEGAFMLTYVRPLK